MMYLFDFGIFVANIFIQGFAFLGNILSVGLNCCNSLFNLVTFFPTWISIPFTALISIAVVFRVSQFVPTIGGAS